MKHNIKHKMSEREYRMYDLLEHKNLYYGVGRRCVKMCKRYLRRAFRRKFKKGEV